MRGAPHAGVIATVPTWIEMLLMRLPRTSPCCLRMARPFAEYVCVLHLCRSRTTNTLGVLDREKMVLTSEDR